MSYIKYTVTAVIYNIYSNWCPVYPSRFALMPQIIGDALEGMIQRPFLLKLQLLKNKGHCENLANNTLLFGFLIYFYLES